MTPIFELDPERVKNNLDCNLIGSEVLLLDVVDSTNERVKELLKEGAPEGLVVIADSQTSGKGRMGRSWVSPPGLGIYLSVLLTPTLSPRQFPSLTLLAGVAAVTAINEFSHTPAMLKWPNDILLKGKKLCGILCELLPLENQRSGVVVGIGININHSATQFPKELRHSATSLKIENGAPVDRFHLVRSLLNHLDSEYEACLVAGPAPLVKKWTEHTDMFDKQISLKQGKSVIHGTAVRLDPLGNLVIRTPDGREHSFEGGEVTLGKP